MAKKEKILMEGPDGQMFEVKDLCGLLLKELPKKVNAVGKYWFSGEANRYRATFIDHKAVCK